MKKYDILNHIHVEALQVQEPWGTNAAYRYHDRASAIENEPSQCEIRARADSMGPARTVRTQPGQYYRQTVAGHGSRTAVDFLGGRKSPEDGHSMVPENGPALGLWPIRRRCAVSLTKWCGGAVGGLTGVPTTYKAWIVVFASLFDTVSFDRFTLVGAFEENYCVSLWKYGVLMISFRTNATTHFKFLFHGPNRDPLFIWVDKKCKEVHNSTFSLEATNFDSTQAPTISVTIGVSPGDFITSHTFSTLFGLAF